MTNLQNVINIIEEIKESKVNWQRVFQWIIWPE
jgi:hypothetical protein